MPDAPAPDVQMNTEDLKTQVAPLTDINVGISTMQTYLRDAKAQPNHFGQTPAGPTAGNFCRQGLNTLADSIGAAQNYVATLISNLQASVGQTAGTEQQNKQNLQSKNEAV